MIQSSLRLSRDALQRAGVRYPLGTDLADTSEARITSGNGGGILKNAAAFARNMTLYDSGSGSHLFSNEMMFQEWLKWPEPALLVEEARKAGFDDVAVLLFIRDPIGHAASLWQQGVKRSGRTMSIERSFGGYEVPFMVAKLIRAVEHVPDITLTIRNYSVCKRDLLGVMEDWLQVANDTLIRPSVKTINRSLTRGELELQLAFNRVFGKCGDLVSDPLCEQLTDVKADRVLPSEEVQHELWSRMRKARRVVNTYAEPAHRYNFDMAEPCPLNGMAELTAEQMRVIAESLATRLRRTSKKKGSATIAEGATDEIQPADGDDLLVQLATMETTIAAQQAELARLREDMAGRAQPLETPDRPQTQGK